MEWEVHEEAVEEFRNLKEEAREVVVQNIESRRNRDNSIFDQRGTGIAYDSHGEPVNYFKAESAGKSFRIFFEADDKIVLLGVRERDDDTYINLRDYSRRT